MIFLCKNTENETACINMYMRKTLRFRQKVCESLVINDGSA